MAPRCSSGIEHKKKDVTTLVEYCEANRMAHKHSEAKFHLFILSAFQKETRDFWQTAYRIRRPFSTTSDKHQVLQMADVFSYKVKGYKPKWRDLVELFV